MELTITKIGDASGIILPQELLDRLKVKSGDTIQITDTPEGFKLSSREDYYDEAMAYVEQVMEEDAVALKRLAE